MAKLIISLLLLLSVVSHGQGWQWAHGFGSDCSLGPHGAVEGFLISAKKPNYIYFAGLNAADSVCIGLHIFYNRNEQSIIGRMDSSGNLIWVIADSGKSYPIDLTTDALGNIYYFGYYTSSSITWGSQTIFNPGIIGKPCYFILKTDSNGNVIHLINGSTCNPGGIVGIKFGGIALDDQCNIYIASTFSDTTMQIGPYTIRDTGLANSRDIFVVKYDSTGSLRWVKHFGGKYEDVQTGVAINEANKLFLTGYFSSDSIKFDTNTLYLTGPIPVHSYPCTYILELDTSGNVIWARSPVGSDLSLSVAAKGRDIYIGGILLDSVLTVGTYNFHHVNNFGTLIKYDTIGNVLWAKVLGPATPYAFGSLTMGEIVFSIALDTSDNVWIIGKMDRNILVDSSIFLDTIGHVDPSFLLCYSSIGRLIIKESLPSGGDDNIGLSLDGIGNTYIAGDYAVSPFVVGTDTMRLNALNTENIFLARYVINKLQPSLGFSVSDSISLSWYPNPIQNKLTLIASSPINNIIITNVLGQVVCNEEYNNNNVQIDVTNLAYGMYILKVNHTIVRKFIKQ